MAVSIQQSEVIPTKLRCYSPSVLSGLVAWQSLYGTAQNFDGSRHTFWVRWHEFYIEVSCFNCGQVGWAFP